ncbi:MAG: enoyl-CoA hydratase/isomerase family protein [Pseudomonadota bacterium]
MDEHAKVTAQREGSLGMLTLDAPATLNSLTLDMVDQLQTALDNWANDDEVKAVFIHASGEKAFCAGGDVQALYRSAIETPGGPCQYAEEFFAREYRMNFSLHQYGKPLIVWGHGIVMGGGLGIFAGCSHKVVTERTRFAMPEITIALFPDVGGSYFLNRMPDNIGRFLGLTAANFNGNDGLYAGFADVMLPHESKQAVLDAMASMEWQADSTANGELVTQCLRDMAGTIECNADAGFIESRLADINALCNGDSQALYQNFVELETEDKWLSKARDGILHGSPLALLWIDRQLEISREMNLAEVFNSELLLGTNIVRHPEFAEGVRALLIDKDRNPQWQFKSLAEVPSVLLDSFFETPWPENPLADLL